MAGNPHVLGGERAALEVMKHLHANGYKTYIVTGGSEDFVRAYAEQVYER
jgi:phosphoserine phosphatase